MIAIVDGGGDLRKLSKEVSSVRISESRVSELWFKGISVASCDPFIEADRK